MTAPGFFCTLEEGGNFMLSVPTLPTSGTKFSLQFGKSQSRYYSEVRKIRSLHPFSTSVGKKNPYNERTIQTENDYDLYCHCYALCRMYEENLDAADANLFNAKMDLAKARQEYADLNKRTCNRVQFMRAAIIFLFVLLACIVFIVIPSLSPRQSSSFSPSASSGGSSRPDGYTSSAFIGNEETHKFHRSSCSYLPDDENQRVFQSRDAAVSAGFDPCGRCNP